MDVIAGGPERVVINAGDGRLIFVGNGGTFTFDRKVRKEEAVVAERLYHTILTIQEFIQKEWKEIGIRSKGEGVDFIINCEPIKPVFVGGLAKDQVNFQLRLHDGSFHSCDSFNSCSLLGVIAYEYMHRVVHSWAPLPFTRRVEVLQQSLTDVLFSLFKQKNVKAEDWPIPGLSSQWDIKNKPRDSEPITGYLKRRCLGYAFYDVVTKVRDTDKVLKIWWTAFTTCRGDDFVQKTFESAGEKREIVFASWQQSIGKTDRSLYGIVQSD